MRFLAYCFLIFVSDFLVRLCSFCRCEMSLWSLSRFAAYFSVRFPISCFLAVMRFHAFWCTIFVRDIPISYFFWPLRALCIRFHTCLVLMRWDYMLFGLPSLGCHSNVIGVLPSAFFSCALTVNWTRPSFLATVFPFSKVRTSSICGYSWHRSTVLNKPSPRSSYLCACPAGTYCPSGTLAAAIPWTCTAGSYCAKGSTATAPCPSGHYCPSSSSLVPCPAGVVEWDLG